MRNPNPDDALWSFETERFRVEFHAEQEDLDPADSFEREDDIAFAREDDPAHWFCAAVYVRLKDTGEIIGRDYLGGCSYNSFREFYTSHRQEPRNTLASKASGVVSVTYFPSMVREACKEARANMLRFCGIKVRCTAS